MKKLSLSWGELKAEYPTLASATGNTSIESLLNPCAQAERDEKYVMIAAISIGMLSIGSYLFERTEVER